MCSYWSDASVRATLVKEPDNTFVLTDHGQIRTRFDAQGRLLSVKDRNGQGLTFTHNAAGLLSTIVDSAGRLITLEYSGGLLTSVNPPGPGSVQYGSTNGRLTTVTDLRGGTATYAYGVDSRVTSLVDQRGNTVFQNTYGADGRVTQQIDAGGDVGTFAWDAGTETSTYTDARGKVWADDYEAGVLRSRTDPVGNTVRYEYSQGDLTSITDARGHKTKMIYDGRRNLLTIEAPSPLSYTQTFAYDGNNNLTASTDGRGNTTTYSYDQSGNLIKLTRPGGNETLYGRDPLGTGLMTSVTDPRGKVTTLGYDSSGNLISVTSPTGARSTIGYDVAGRMTSVVDPRGNVEGANPDNYRWAFSYDAAGHLIGRTDPLGNAMSWTYDAVGNLQSVTDANGHTTSYGYSDANDLLSVTAPGNVTTTYEYDAVGNLITRADDNDHVTSYEYDDGGRLSEVTDPLGNAWTYAYDASGNPQSVTDAEGNATPASGDGIVTFVHDGLNRLTGMDFSDSTPDVTWSYNANSNPIQMTDGLGTETSGYDVLNRVDSVTRGSDGFSYLYDAAGNVTRRIYPDGTQVDLVYDDDGRLSTVTSGGKTFSYEYDVAGNPTKIIYPNGTEETRVYDRAGRVTEVAHRKGTNILASFVYTLDPVGNPTRVDTPSETITYDYDALDRLTEACYQADCPLPSDPFIRYTHDGVGNRLTEVRPSGTTTYTYNAGDRLLSWDGPLGTSSFTYDRNGNQTAVGNQTLTWNQRGLMASVTDGTNATTYEYDGSGRRLRATSGSDVTKFSWDVARPLPELVLERDGPGNLKRRYLYGEDLLQMTTGGSDYTYHHDALGSVASLTTDTGDRVANYLYEPFGSERPVDPANPSTPDNRMRFTGEYLDPTGFYHLRARQYDPAAGRFGSPDPFPPMDILPYTAAYSYVGNRPTFATDPSGQCFILCAVIGAVTNALVYTVTSTVRGDFSVKGLFVSAGTGALSGLTGGAASFFSGGNVAITAAGYFGGSYLSSMGASHICGVPFDSDQALATAAWTGASGGASAAWFPRHGWVRSVSQSDIGGSAIGSAPAGLTMGGSCSSGSTAGSK